MDKKLRKHYYRLDLPFSATEEDVKDREKALIKILTVKEKEKNISCSNEIKKIQEASEEIIINLKNNGIPKEEPHGFSTTNESLIVMFIILVFVGIACWFSFTLI